MCSQSSGQGATGPDGKARAVMLGLRIPTAPTAKCTFHNHRIYHFRGQASAYLSTSLTTTQRQMSCSPLYSQHLAKHKVEADIYLRLKE